MKTKQVEANLVVKVSLRPEHQVIRRQDLMIGTNFGRRSDDFENKESQCRGPSCHCCGHIGDRRKEEEEPRPATIFLPPDQELAELRTQNFYRL
jgi:hypothetical protein